MTDGQIIELYWNRNERAISETSEKYGAYCYAIAFNILNDKEDSKESVNDTYIEAWNKMPPHKPNVLKSFLGRIARCISVDKLREKTAKKRGGGEFTDVLEELSDCVAKCGNPIGEAERKLLNETVNDFIKKLKETEQKVFLCRYWYAESVKKIAEQFGFSESKVKSMLMRTRKKLYETLKTEGLL